MFDLTWPWAEKNVQDGLFHVHMSTAPYFILAMTPQERLIRLPFLPPQITCIHVFSSKLSEPPIPTLKSTLQRAALLCLTPK